MKQKKILAVIGIVDDDESVRDSISSLLRSAGYKTESFESAEAYLNSDRASEPNCLLLDVRMPGLSGLQLQSELNHQKVSIPVIFITAHPDEQVRERALSEGAVAVLGKPFNDEVLLGAIDSAVGSKGPSAT
jgi:FixJ family two-component response regulator